jgi:hypothetical protein
MALNLVFWPISGAIRRHYRHRLEIGDAQRSARWWIRVVCAVNLIFALGMFKLLSSSDLADFSHKFDFRINFFQVIGVLGVLGTVLVLIGWWRLIRDQAYWFWAKAWTSLVLVACIGFVWCVLYWNLLDFRMNY